MRKSPTSKGKNHYNWNGGVWNFNGYRYILKPEHPRAKSKKGYVAEHVLKMEKKLGRYLNYNAVVHHKNNNKIDNRLGNLLLFDNNSKHMSMHAKLRKKKYGYMNSPETRKKISIGMMGNKNGKFNRKREVV